MTKINLNYEFNILNFFKILHYNIYISWTKEKEEKGTRP